jgi:hypothetical protein
MYVLNVDLWSEDATKEVNLVRHTTSTPSISSTTQASFGSIESVTPAYAHILPSNRPDYAPQVSYPPAVNPYSVPQGYAGMFQLAYLSVSASGQVIVQHQAVSNSQPK